MLGHDVVRDADAVRHVIGYMSQDFFGVYKDMEGAPNALDFFESACYKIPTVQREKTVNDVLELVGLTEKKGALIGALSRGACSSVSDWRGVLIHDPQLLLLDEPASGAGSARAH